MNTTAITSTTTPDALAAPTQNQTRFDFASSIIAAAPVARLLDRAFAAPVLFSLIVWIVALNGKITYEQAVDFTKWAIGPFVLAEKGKDALVAYGALKGGSPDTVNAGTANISASETPSPQPQTGALNIEDFNIGAATGDREQTPAPTGFGAIAPEPLDDFGGGS